MIGTVFRRSFSFEDNKIRGFVMKRFCCGLLALGLLLGSAGHAKTQPTYAFTRLAPGPYSSGIRIIPYGINASGQNVGGNDGSPGNNGGFWFRVTRGLRG
jgi:hypothetical protein